MRKSCVANLFCCSTSHQNNTNTNLMKKHLLIIALLCFLSSTAQVTQIWTDYNNYWTSSSITINPIKPNTSHNLLAFKWNGTTYSTAVNNAKLTANGVTFSPTKFRALPINEVPLSGPNSAYFIGLGALTDGLPNAVDNGSTNPFAPITSGTRKATYLTKGVQGLDLGTCLTNIPAGPSGSPTTIRFNLSSAGITLSNVGDGIPDILISQIAQPSASNADTFRFVNSAGVTVGNVVTALLSNATQFPVVGNWNPDFYENNSTQPQSTFVNTERPLRFYALDLSAFGITSTNYSQAVALVYNPGGDSDPAFLAFNEPSLGISTKLAVTSQPTTSTCDGTMTSTFQVRLEDRFNLPVLQAGITITASMETGPGALLGTLTATTDANGIATFSNLSFEVGGNHKIRFSNSSLDAAITSTIAGAIGCLDNIWTGNGTNSNWNNAANWQTGVIPNANNNVEIPAGRPRYPILQNSAGAKNITLGAGASIDLNGKLFTIAGNVTRDATAKIIADKDNSNLYYSGASYTTIENGLIQNGLVANLTIEQGGDVYNDDNLKITQVLLVKGGTFYANYSTTVTGTVEMVCRFEPTRRTAQIGPIASGSYIIGNITVEQCFPARRAFRLISSPVTTFPASIRANWQENATAWNDNPKPGYGTHITGVGASGSTPINDGLNGFDWQPSGASSLFTFNNNTQAWGSVTNTTDYLVQGQPYRILIRGDRSTNIQSNAAVPTNTILRTTGSLNQGDQYSNVSYQADGFSFVGNPYQANVDMGKVIAGSVNIKPFYTIWDPTLGGAPTVGQQGGRGAYVTINALTGVSSSPISQATTLLQPYQAFFVQTINGFATTELIFKEEYKAVNGLQTNVFKLNNNTDETVSNQFIEMSLYNQQAFDANDTPSDGLRIDFSSTASNDINEFDAPKFSNLDESISRKVGDALISMENRELPQVDELLPLNITQYRRDAYTMSINLSAFAEYNVYLKDFFTNEDILLENGTISNYSFTVNEANPASKAADRFSFSFQENLLGVQQSAETLFNLYPNPTNGNALYLNTNSTFDSAQIEIYNLIGQKVLSFNADFGSNKQISIPVSSLKAGMYIMSAKTNNGQKFTSKFIKN